MEGGKKRQTHVCQVSPVHAIQYALLFLCVCAVCVCLVCVCVVCVCLVCGRLPYVRLLVRRAEGVNFLSSACTRSQQQH